MPPYEPCYCAVMGIGGSCQDHSDAKGEGGSLTSVEFCEQVLPSEIIPSGSDGAGMIASEIILEDPPPRRIPSERMADSGNDALDADTAVLEAMRAMSLTDMQALGLHKRVRGRAKHSLSEKEQERADEAAAHGVSSGHGHGEKPQSIATALASALINFLLMFGLCCAYGMILFSDDFNKRHRGLGIKMNLGTAMVFGFLLACCSKVPVAIGGPDLNPVVFIGGMVQTASAGIAKSLELEGYPTKRRLMEDGGRMLAGASSQSDFCEDSWISMMLTASGQSSGRLLAGASPTYAPSSASALDYEGLCEDYHAQLRATTIFATVVSSALLGLLFFLLGKFKLSRYVSYVPASVSEAFLSCIGYKVFKYALEFCLYDINQFGPAALVGVPLYFLKAYHIGHPAVVMPLGLLVPLGIFYILVFATGNDIESMRAADWFFPELENTPFTKIWEDGFLKPQNVNFKAFMGCFPDLAVMIIVITLDCMLKIAATETKMPIKTDKNYEIKLYGAGNVFSVLLGQSVGYMQLKFNVINYGVLGNLKDRRAGMIYASFCGVCFLWSTDLINYLPRVFLGSLLFFAGAGFVCENLWGSRKILNFVEWMEILVILAVFILSGQLLYAVGVGVLLTGLTFIRKYASVSAIAGRPLTGAEVTTHEATAGLASKNLAHIANRWLIVTKLRGFVFFASVQGITDSLTRRIEDEVTGLEPYQRMKYAVFDCEHLDGMDVSAAKGLKKLTKEAAEHGVRILFSGLSPSLVQDFILREVITDVKDLFKSLEEAVIFVEEHILHYCTVLQKIWVNLHPAFHLAMAMQMSNEGCDPFQQIFNGDSSRFNSPWRYCSKMKMSKYRTVLYRYGEVHSRIYLVHRGSLGLFKRIPKQDCVDPDEWGSPAKIYVHGCFLNVEALAMSQAQTTAVCMQSGEVVYWTQEQWWRMSREQPMMVRDILRAVMRQQVIEAAAGTQAPLLDDSNQPVERTSSTMAATMTGQHSVGGSPQKPEQQPYAEEARANLQAKAKESPLDRIRLYVKRSQADIRERVDEERRRRELEEAIASPHADGGGPKQVLPAELRMLLQELEATNSLADQGFFAPVPAESVAAHPEMCTSMTRDLHNAFSTYCHSEEGEDRMLDWKHLEACLRYGGIFNALMETAHKHAERPQGLTLAEFMEVAHSAAMAKLSAEHISIIRRTFKVYDRDASGSLDLAELADVFQLWLHPNNPVCVETVDGIASGFCKGGGMQDHYINEEDFIRIMARYVRRHDSRWVLLKGILDVMGTDYQAASNTLVTRQDMESIARRLGHEDQVPRLKELLWAADWLRDGAGNGETLTFPGLVGQLAVMFSTQTTVLPPAPVDSVSIYEAPPELEKPVGFNPEQYMVDFTSIIDISSVKAKSYDLSRLTTRMSWLDEIDRDDAMTEKESVKEDVIQTMRMKIRETLEEPNSSTLATAVSAFTGVMILLSVLTLVVEPIIKEKVYKAGGEDETMDRIFRIAEIYFTIVFSLEFLLRLLVCDARVEFLVTPGNVTDVAAILPGWIDIVFTGDTAEFKLLRIIRMARISRMARVARLANKSTLAPPVAMVLVVIWGIYMKHGLKSA